MSDRLPPLTALRAFEAAARHMSFAEAARELHVTPAALSFQIKSLEEHLGAPVFRRLNRAVELTDAGLALYPGAHDGFEALRAAWSRARRCQDRNTLTLTAGPAFTAKWLAPRMFGFTDAHPEIELRLAATTRKLDLVRDEIDVAIRFGTGPDDGEHAIPIMRDWLTPMMTPALAKRFPTPASLNGAHLLHDFSIAHLDPPCDWPAWFRASGIAYTAEPGTRFNQGDHVIDAALGGAGVMLGRWALTRDALRDGLLVAPFPIALSTEAHFRVVCAKGMETRPKVRAFLTWLKSEAAGADDLADGRTFIAAADVAAMDP